MKIHQIQGYIQNTFLVEYPHGCLLLDGASRLDFHTIKRFFTETLQRPFTDLLVVVVTHMHPDHAGCAHKLREATGCLVITGTFDRQWYSGLSGRFQHLIDLSLGYWVAGRLGRERKLHYYSPHIHPDQQLSEGESLPHFPDWHIINTPGHTAMDISVVNHQRQTLYAADLMVWVKKELSPPFPIHLPEAYKSSLEKLRQFTGYELLLAHVKPMILSNKDIDKVLQKAPTYPKTTLETIKSKLKLKRNKHFKTEEI